MKSRLPLPPPPGAINIATGQLVNPISTPPFTPEEPPYNFNKDGAPYYVPNPKYVPLSVTKYLEHVKAKGQGAATIYQSPKNWIASHTLSTGGKDLGPWLLSYGYDITRNKAGIPGPTTIRQRKRKTRKARKTRETRK